MRTPRSLVVVALALLTSLGVSATALLLYQVRIPSTGIVASIDIGVYSDQACTNPLNSTNWGLVYPGESYGRVVYVKTLGNLNVTLAITTGDFEPSSASKILVTTDYGGQVLAPGQVLPLKITMTIPTDIEGMAFSFDIRLTAQG